MNSETPDSVLEFWFSERMEKAWFAKDEAIDREIAERFAAVHEAARDGGLDGWRDRPRGALARTIALDQFPRNLHRDSPRAFATDDLALAGAEEAIARGFDQQLSEKERQFFYLPFMHSEDIDVQRRSLDLYRALGNENLLGYAVKHHDIVERFDRFPHRNEVLGRESTAEEVEFLKDNPGF